VRRWFRVLRFIFQPLRPGSDLVGGVQIALVIALPLLAAVFPFIFAQDWTWLKAMLVVLAVLLGLSLWAAYQLEARVEIFLGDTPLQATIATQIKEGNELLRRLRRQPGGEVSKSLSDMVVSWGGRTIRDINDVAPEVGNELNAKYAYLEVRDREGQILYVRRFLGGLEKVGEELQGLD
jgi:hypothetical protein